MGHYDGSRHGDVAARAAVHARRQLLHGRVRRLVPQPPVPGLRVRAGVSRTPTLAAAKPTIASSRPMPTARFCRLTLAAAARRRPRSTAPPRSRSSGNLTPKNYFGDGTFRAVNTMQPRVSAERRRRRPDDTTRCYADPASADDAAAADAADDRRPARRQGRDVGLVRRRVERGERRRRPRRAVRHRQRARCRTSSPHHQPFNYYAAFDPATHAA